MDQLHHFDWAKRFGDLFRSCLERYQSGNADYNTYYTEDDLIFLRSIGYKEREFFDFIEDYGDEGEPSPETALLIAAARRDYFLVRMEGKTSSNELQPEDLPGKTEELGGFVWLPRIIAKAKGKLRGELHPDIMFSCGGDRKFLKTHDIAPADFLRVVWSAESEDAEDEVILDFVRSVSRAGQ